MSAIATLGGDTLAQAALAPPPAGLTDAEAVRRVVGCSPPAAALRRLVAQGLDRLPLPGAGRTLERWRALAAVGAVDLALAKIFEGHTDALAILAALAPVHLQPAGGLWGVWAAEAAGLSLDLVTDPGCSPPHSGGFGTLCGVKPWCSGAGELSHALVTAHVGGGHRQLYAVDLGGPGVRVDHSRWHAVGMASSGSAEVHFDGVRAVAVGEPGAYLDRPGFWHGGAGVAACWFGAARALAGTLLTAPPALTAEGRMLRAVALGRVSMSMTHSSTLLTRTAALVDAEPEADLCDAVRLLRLSVDQTARQVLDEVMRALGPTPFCRDPALARLAADLPIFVRQCHADGDLLQAGHAALACGTERVAWPL